MLAEKLTLQGFRNYESLEFTPAKGINVLVGDNAQGKTNLIEAIHLCCVGRSHRTSKDAELIRLGDPGAIVRLQTEASDGKRMIEVFLQREGEKKKLVRLNHIPVQRIGELMGQVNAVMFSPEDLKLIKEGPEGRRKFLDMEISQLYPAYFYALQRYVHCLTQRNILLRKIAENGSLTETLDDWDLMLAQSGEEVIRRRMLYVEQLKKCAVSIHGDLSESREVLTVEYSRQEAPDTRKLVEMLAAARREDLRRMSTSVGPHRDDIRICIDGREARAFGSQGQQRTAALSLKLAELEVMRETLKESPILLLDDVMSELDIERRKMLLKRISGIQTLITCTHLSDLGGAEAEKICMVKKGTLEEK